MKRFPTALIVISLAAPASLKAQTPTADHIVVTPDQLHWTPYYAGGEQAVLLGDPSRPGPYVLRVRFPKGLRIAPHYHLDNRIVQVLSGTMYFTVGESEDTTKMRAIPAGSLWTEPAHMIHNAWTGDGEVVLQVVGTGPTGTVPAPTGVLGRWVGESKCVGSQPACHDEHVIYQIDSVGPARFAMEGFRVVGKDTVDMGPLSCQSAPGDSGISCRIPQGVWRFSVVGGRLEGVLTESNDAVTRRAVADRH